MHCIVVIRLVAQCAWATATCFACLLLSALRASEIGRRTKQVEALLCVSIVTHSSIDTLQRTRAHSTLATMAKTEIRVGVLALQGAFEEHIDMLHSVQLVNADGAAVKVHAFAVRLPAQLADADALVLPGGESTTIGKVAVRWGLVEPLKEWVAAGKPIWGTCAGMIMLAQSAKHAEAVRLCLCVVSPVIVWWCSHATFVCQCARTGRSDADRRH